MADIPAGTSTSGSIAVGGTVSGSLEVAGDHDWYRVSLTAGQSITISLFGSSGNPVTDTYLRLYDSTGKSVLATNDDSGGGLNSKIVFTVTTSGTYFIDAGAWDVTSDPPAPANQYTGGYTLSVQPWTPPPVATYDQIANQLINGYWNASGETAHHFNVKQGGTITVNLSALTSVGQALAVAALAEWTDIIGVNFTQVTSGGQIVFDDNADGAFTDDNYSGGITTSAHVNVSTQWLSDYGTGIDSYSFQTYIHEIGHALGLGHSGNYNGDADFAADALFRNDAWSTSIMSYFSPADNSYFSSQGFSDNLSLTPMIADIAAMQKMYGLSTITRTGNTTYGFNSDAGNVYNPAVIPDATYTIFDSGGVDTINYAGSAADQLINLNAETFSNVNGRTGNVAIGRGVVIENATTGSGNDTIIGNAANNVLTGGAGQDIVSYATATAGVRVDLRIATQQDTAAAGRDTLSGFEGLVGSAFGDTLIGSSSTVSIRGGLGNDTIYASSGSLFGEGGNDTFVIGSGAGTIDGGDGWDTVTYSGATSGKTVDISRQGPHDDLLYNIEEAIGSDFADKLTGDSSANVLRGNGGNDILDGAAGADQLSGGTGNDTFFVDNARDAVLENAGEGTDLVNASVSFTLGGNVENLQLMGTSAINGIGNALNNVITGGAGDNILSGMAGNDTLGGGSGGNDRLDGGLGADMMVGGIGNDIYYVDNAGDKVVENAGEGTDLVVSTIAHTLAVNADNLQLAGTLSINGAGNALNNVILGNTGANYLYGLDGNDTIQGDAGNDRLYGGAGSDRLYGGAANDIYFVDTLGDAIVEAAGDGTDLVVSSVSITIGKNLENLTLSGASAINATGSADNNVIQGNAAANIIAGMGGNDVIKGNGGNDRLDGGTGIDKMYGGTGDDIYYVDNAGDVVGEVAGQGTDSVFSSVAYTLTSNVEYLTLTGDAAIDGTGNGLDNLIRGTSADNAIAGLEGNDKLQGFEGSDTLSGGGGNDTLYGGAGTDLMSGGTGADGFVFGGADFGGLTGSSADRIIDFSQVEGDKVNLSAVDANALVAGDQAFQFIGSDAFHNVAGELRFEQSGQDTYVYGDTDGDGIADFLIRFDGTHTFVTNDFGL